MAQRMTRKELLKQDEFVEAAPDIVDWFEHHKSLVLQIVAGVVIVTAAVGGWSLWSDRREKAAERELAEGLRYLSPAGAGDAGSEAPQLDKALTSFEQASRTGGSGSLGAVASFYRGATLLRLGRADEAVPVLREAAGFKGNAALADSARALLAQALEASGDIEGAAATLRAIAGSEGGVFPADLALLQLGELRRRAGDSERAREVWQEILSRYPQGAAAAQARTALGAGGGAPVQ